MWSIAKRSTLTIAQLDGLFTLPSVSSIVSHPQLLLFVEVPFLVVVILALPLITIFAPAAMVTSVANPTTTNVSVPTIDLQHMQNAGIVGVVYNSTIGVTPTANWMSSAQTAIEASTPISWPTPPPAGCSASCNYTMTYAAPALTCLDLRSDQIFWVGKSSSSKSPPGTLIVLDRDYAYNATAVNGTMTLAWTPYFSDSSDLLIQGQPLGATCTFVNAIYRASISYHNGSQSLWTEIISTGQMFYTDGQEYLDSPDSSVVPVNLQMTAFANAFISPFNKALDTSWILESDALAPPLFVPNSTALSLRSDVSSLSQGLTSLVGNVTLSLIAYTNATDFVELESQSNRRLYDIRAFPLALTYGVAFSLSGVVIALGMQALLSGHTFRPVSFSQFLLTTHNPEMDQWMKAGSRLGALTLTDEELGTRMTFDGTSFQPIWATKEKNESDNGEERNDERDPLHAEESTHDEQSVGDRDHLDSDQIRGSVATDQNEGAEAEDGTPATAVNLTPHSSQSEL
jgi:hypothetical protein